MIFNHLKEISKNTLLYGAGQGIRRFFSIFTAPILTRIFSPADYGVISLISTTLAFSALVISLGISAGIFRNYYDVNDAEKKVLLFSGITSQMIIICLIIILAEIFADTISLMIFGTNSYGRIIRIALIQIPLIEIFEHFATLLRYQNRPKTYLFISSFQLACNLFFLLFYVIYLKLGIEGIFLGIISSYAIPLVILWIKQSKYYTISFHYEYVKKSLAFSIPLMPGWFINMYLMQSNRFFLQSFHSSTEVGLYSIGDRIAGIMSVVMTMFFLAWDPLSMKIINNKFEHRVYDSVARIFLFLSSILIICITFFSKEALIIFTTSKYYSAFKYPGLIAFGTMTFYLNYFLGQGIIINKKTIYQSYARIVGAIFATIVFLLLIPNYSGMGASIGLVIGYFISGILLIYFSEKLYHLPYKYYRIALSYFFTFSVISIYLISTTDSFSLSLMTILIKCIFILLFIILLLFITFTRDELNKIMEKMSKFSNGNMRSERV
ncbi:MAG: hypothetical protein A2499_03230 [Stygiobacter sp. RIFOXYC12_FULL_38_8]|nr:MAG: hypothetical protein A2440_06505 [Stygiobacter sp. RIFOXYC2_FULL_38_25]OGV17908.1 MAG: hypothetical protein A2237_03260 [Stygiobacter sp. RIFOXYA2_FULL_38_8]OGV22122.1 MAG: hypothetical protein A2499_03230 [Stygiobacter sp. RIFOXYC12_FULL_38_8]OGV79570.1 MAG: hypothetical protein A2X65_18585 [Stygiobacter sp. GWF2_38_21]